MIRVVAHVTAKPDKIEHTRNALLQLIAPTRAEDGCVKYELLQNEADPTDFAFVEEWASQEALDKHFRTAHFNAANSAAADLLSSPPDIRTYRVIA